MAMKKVYNEQVIDAIEITDSVEIVFYYDYLNDKVWANIREFIKSKKYTGPTKQGIKFDPVKLPEIKKAFDKANEQADTIQDEEFLRITRSPNRDLVGVQMGSNLYILHIYRASPMKKLFLKEYDYGD